jgi:hypothetical protein
VVPALTRLGCNQGACHGTPNGKHGFRLSLQGYAPEFDYAQLALQGGGRRANRADPGSSLILLKPTTRLPHGGGLRLLPSYPEWKVLTRWIAEGLRDDPPGHPALVRLEVTPSRQVVVEKEKSQQLLVQATFSDGSSRDVTPLVRFSSTDDSIASVSRDGLVQARRRGEVAVLCRYQHLTPSVRFTFTGEVPGFKWPDPPVANEIDRDVFAKLQLLQIPPSDLCSDAEFLRRVTLDGTGELPGLEEARRFLADRSPDRRARLIDQVLARPEFADFWALKWSDVLLVNEATLGEDGVRAYHRWLRDAIAADRPMDQLVRDLLTASGKPSANPAANFYQAVPGAQSWMEVTAQVFMGVRVACARCHNHPFDRWTQDEYYQLAAFFSQVEGSDPERPGGEIRLKADAQVVQPRTGKEMRPKFLGGPAPDIPPGADRRPFLANWLTAADNPFFARALANRVWYHLMGRGIVEPVDDFRDSNPPANDALLATLTSRLVKDGFRLRPLVKFIMNSRTYQLGARSEPLNQADGLYFSHAMTRLLTAEQLMDAISSVTGVPATFPGFPAGTRAVQLPGTRVESPFLKAFGRPDRSLPCECERGSDTTLFQALQLINGRDLRDKLRSDSGRIAALARSSQPVDAAIDELYLVSLTRLPTAAERVVAHKYIDADRRAGLEDLGWALINSKEFVFRH